MALTFITNFSLSQPISLFINKFIFYYKNLLKSTGVVSNLPISKLSNLLFKMFKPIGASSNLWTSNLLTFEFKLPKSNFPAKSDVSIPVEKNRLWC